MFAIRNFCLILLLLPLFVACRSAEQQQLSLDRNVYGLIQDKSAAFSQANLDWDLEQKSDQLRKAIFEKQGHYIATAASIAAVNLPKVEGEGDAAYRQFNSSICLSPDTTAGIVLNLKLSLELAAQNSRAYQARKERVFQAGLALDLARYDFGIKVTPANFESSWTEDYLSSSAQRGLSSRTSLGLSRRTVTGATFRSSVTADLVQLIGSKSATSFGLASDSSISIPLLRGSGAHIVGEPLTQAERKLEYELAEFNAYRSEFVIQIARAYFDVLRILDQIHNAGENYESLERSTRRVALMAESGRIPETQVDQARQEEFRSRLRFIAAKSNYAARLDRLKIEIGLPVETELELDESELDRLPVPASAAEAWPHNKTQHQLYQLAFNHRHDFLVHYRRVEDAQRQVVIATDGLRAEFSIGGSVSAGGGRSLSSATADPVYPNFNQGFFQGWINLDLPFDRHVENYELRSSIINFKSRLRAYQLQEDELKLSIRDSLRDVARNLEDYSIQYSSQLLAERRVERAKLLLQAGRIKVRDLLEAEEDLVLARNALTDTRVNYQILLWTLERHLGVFDTRKFI